MDPLSSDIGSVDLTEYLRRLRRRSWLVIVGVLAGVTGALVWSSSQDALFRSETAVLVLPVDAGTSATLANGRTSGTINLDTEAQIIRSAVIAEAVHNDLAATTGAAVPTVPELMDQLEVAVPPNSQVVQIGFVAGTAADAQLSANTYAKAYLSERSSAVTAAVEETHARLSEQRDGLQGELASVIEEIREFSEQLTEPPELALVEARRDMLVSQLNAIDTELAALSTVRAQPGRVLTAAPLPDQPVSPNPVLNAAAGILVGLVLGVGGAIVADRLDRRIRRTSDVERARFPLIGAIPGSRRRLTTLDAGREDGVDDAADRIRNRLVSYAGNARVIQVAPASPNHRCGLAAAALAASFGREHGRALLVVADPGSPVALRLAGEPAGLSDMLLDASRPDNTVNPSTTLDDAVLVLPDELPRVAIMGPGTNPAQLGRVIQPRAMTKLLQRADDYPIVIVETGYLGSASAQAVARAADVVVLVAVRGLSDARSMAAAGENLSGLHARLGGVVLAPRLDPPSEDGPPLSVGFGPGSTVGRGSTRGDVARATTARATTARGTAAGGTAAGGTAAGATTGRASAVRTAPAHSDRARTSRRRSSTPSSTRSEPVPVDGRRA